MWHGVDPKYQRRNGEDDLALVPSGKPSGKGGKKKPLAITDGNDSDDSMPSLHSVSDSEAEDGSRDDESMWEDESARDALDVEMDLWPVDNTADADADEPPPSAALLSTSATATRSVGLEEIADPDAPWRNAERMFSTLRRRNALARHTDVTCSR